MWLISTHHLLYFFFVKENAWIRFKKSIPHIQESDTCTRLSIFVAECMDPFAYEVRYHKPCWLRYVHSSTEDDQENNENDQRNLIQKRMFDHVRSVIFEEKEPRSLTGLLWDYNILLESSHLPTCEQTIQLKTLLIKEFGEDIGFHVRYHRNKGTIVYDASAGGSYIEAAINSWGVSDNQLLLNVAKRMKMYSKDANGMTWPPRAADLEENINPPLEILKLVTLLQNPN